MNTELIILKLKRNNMLKINNEILTISLFIIFVLFLALQLMARHDEARIIEWIFIATTPILSFFIYRNKKLSNQIFYNSDVLWCCLVFWNCK